MIHDSSSPARPVTRWPRVLRWILFAELIACLGLLDAAILFTVIESGTACVPIAIASSSALYTSGSCSMLPIMAGAVAGLSAFLSLVICVVLVLSRLNDEESRSWIMPGLFAAQVVAGTALAILP